MEKKSPTPPPELLTLLSAYHFPGNVRQLRAMVFDAVARHQGGVLSMASFQKAIKGQNTPPAPTESPPQDPSQKLLQSLPDPLPTLKIIERALVAEALRRAKNNQGIAARFLGISRQALNQRLRKQNKAKPADQT